MNPIVEAAWIAASAGLVGVGGTVTVAIVGFRSTRSATIATLAAARDDKVFDKRAEAYVDLLASLSWAQISRLAWRMTMAGLEHPPLPVLALDYLLVDARVRAFGTPKAFAAVRAYETAFALADDAFKAWKSNPSELTKTAALIAIKAADDSGHAIDRLVRRELGGDTTELPDWQPPGPNVEPSGE